MLDFRVHEDKREFTHTRYSTPTGGTVVTVTISRNGFARSSRALSPTPSNIASYHHDYAQQGWRVIYNDHTRRYEEHSLLSRRHLSKTWGEDSD